MLLYSRVAPGIAPDLDQEINARDPLNAHALINGAYRALHSSRLENARQLVEEARELAPDAIRVQVFDALIYFLEGDFETAARLAGELNPPIRLCALQRLGNFAEVKAALGELQRTDREPATALAMIHACRGDVNRAFALLDRAYDTHEQILSTIRGNRFLEILHDDPRWGALLEKIGISDDHARQVMEILEGADTS